MNNTLYVLDSYALIYRSYYAFINKPLLNTSGENVSAIHGFFNSLQSLLKTYTPCFFLAAFDSRVPTFRHELFDQYKATRQKTPEDLHAQIPIIEEILTTLGIPLIRCDGYEADDIIATLVCACKAENRPCRILSGDKDLMQLIGGETNVLKPDRMGGWQHIDGETVFDEWGIRPDQMLDYLSLVGDASDNIPGISGIGDKTAVKLLTQYDTLENIYTHIDEITGAAGKKIAAGKEDAYFSRKLVTLCETVPVDIQLESFGCVSLDYTAASRLLHNAGLVHVARTFAEIGSTVNGKSDEATPSKAISATGKGKEPVLPNTSSLASPVELKENTGKYTCITDIYSLDSLISRAIEQQYVAFDCETTSLDTHTTHMAGFSLSLSAGEGFYIPLDCSFTESPGTDTKPEEKQKKQDQQADLFTDETQSDKTDTSCNNTENSALHDTAALPYIGANDVKKSLERLFSNQTLCVITHNGKFDYEVLHTWGLSKPLCRFADTMIAAWLLSPERVSFSLESLSQVHLGLKTTAFTDIVPKGTTFADVPREEATQYASEDADLTLQLWLLFEPLLKKSNLYDLFTNLEMPLLPILADMEIEGIHIEKKQLAAYSTELIKQIAHIQKDIFELVGHEFNIASPKQLQEVLFVERKLPTAKKTKTGFSTDTGVLEDLAKLDPVAAKIVQFRMLTKLQSTYVNALPLLADSNGRLHTSFIQTGTATGRLSSREPNLQNIPIRDEEGRRIRSAFTARDGFQLISADYAQIELVILAHLSNDVNLLEAFRSNSDVHKRTASLIFGIAENEVTPDMRRTAKTINFGVMYGMSAFRLSDELGISRTQASEFINSYFTTYSGIQSFMDKTIAFAEETGYVETILGRRRYIANIHSKNKMEKSGAERIAVNTPIQGSAADIVKKAMIDVTSALQKEHSSAQLLLQVHDELIFECPDDEVAQAKSVIQAHMEHTITLQIPLRVSIESGKNWGEFH